MILLWCSGSLTYYLISFQLKYLKGNLFINNYISDASEVFANIFAITVLKWLGYKKTIVVSYIVAAIGMLSLIFFGDSTPEWVSLIFILLSKLGVSSAYLLSYLGNSKVFDQTILATSMGLCSCLSRAANILS
jgi:Na+/melibiose symporter-like transporter